MFLFWQFQNRRNAEILRIHVAHEPLVAHKLTPACRSPSLIKHRFSCLLLTCSPVITDYYVFVVVVVVVVVCLSLFL